MNLPILSDLVRHLLLSLFASLVIVVIGMCDRLVQDASLAMISQILKEIHRYFDVLIDPFINIDGRTGRPAQK